MLDSERRKTPRVDSWHLSYIVVDQENTVVMEGIGRTLNISDSGLLLETHFNIDPAHFLILTIAMENELLENIRCKVVYCRKGKSGLYETGAQFTDIDSTNLEILRKYH